MKFAFLIHPINQHSKSVLALRNAGGLQESWGSQPFAFSKHLRKLVALSKAGEVTEPQLIDEITGFTSDLGAETSGRYYMLSMDPVEILEQPHRALEQMQQAAGQAEQWNAELLGLGALTGIIGGRGQYLSQQSRLAITTGNSLTVYAALCNVQSALLAAEMDLSRETVAIIGVPGSIATCLSRMLAGQCRELLMIGRRHSSRSQRIAEKLGGNFSVDIANALSRARVILSATSTGDCIDQRLLQPGSIVIDVAVPADIHGTCPIRPDVLLLSGGLVSVPRSTRTDQGLLWFHHGIIPACQAETIVLALEKRAECFSLGQELDVERVQEIGTLAESHGFGFSRLFSFGLPLADKQLVQFRKHVQKTDLRKRRGSGAPAAESRPLPPIETLTARAAGRHEQYINPVMMTLGAEAGFVKTFASGSGTCLKDADGINYLDFVSGFGAVNLGHNHPAVVAALKEAINRAAPGFAQSAVNPYAAALAERLISIAPERLEMVFFTNSGTESVEASLKLARLATGRSGLLSCQGSFHGKSLGSLSVTSNPTYQKPFTPLIPDCHSIPFDDLAALERALADRKFAAFIVEPIQAEGGMNVPDREYLRGAQQLCREAGTLLIVDEIQTGMGRTGKMFAVEHTGAEPDIMTLAKSLGGSLLPIGAMLVRRDLWLKAYGTIDKFALHSSTFSGGSLACAVGLATIDVLLDQRLPTRAAWRGRQLRQALEPLCDQLEGFVEVRGQGLLMGIEIAPWTDQLAAHWKAADQMKMNCYLIPEFDQKIESLPAMMVVQTLLDAHHIYAQVTRSNPRVVRIQPPLTVDQFEVEHFLKAMASIGREGDFGRKMMKSLIGVSAIGIHDAAIRGPDSVGSKTPLNPTTFNTGTSPSSPESKSKS